MKIIVGLGNPGSKYEKTRHNAGFIVIDHLAKRLDVTVKTLKFKALVGETFVMHQKVILVKPQTFMNLSGEAVGAVMDYYGANIEDLLVISDDKDLDVGALRIRQKGSSGGQNGIKNIIQHLGTQEFARVKVGIGSNARIATADYVMGQLDGDAAIASASDAAFDFINGNDVLELMNRYNGKGQ